MAYNNNKVLLGYEDEAVTDKHKGLVNFTVNKMGGLPDWPPNVYVETPQCSLCQLPTPLVFQIYAPLDNSQYNRTLYLFACINPNCWNQNESWKCIRVQSLEQLPKIDTLATTNTVNVSDWCTDANDWDDNNDNMNEENGNIVDNCERGSEEEEDESCSLEESISSALGNITVDDRNANMGGISPTEAQGGAVGRQNSPQATAEIEGDEGEVVTIDTPTTPQHNIAALLQEAAPLPQELCFNKSRNNATATTLQFACSFISVGEEMTKCTSNLNDHHVRELLQEYQHNNEEMLNIGVDSGGGGGGGGVGGGVSGTEAEKGGFEKYEKGVPAHGDKMFHHFLSKLQMNPGQILRYNRNGIPPLLMSPLQEVPKKCSHCQDDLIFEMQVLPTAITKLRLVNDLRETVRLEFGTVLIFSCKRSCWSTEGSVRYETVIVQSENM